MPSNNLILFSSDLCTTSGFPSSSLRRLDLWPSKWRLNALERLILPDPVSLNRLEAPELVFIFGMIPFFGSANLNILPHKPKITLKFSPAQRTFSPMRAEKGLMPPSLLQKPLEVS